MGLGPFVESKLRFSSESHFLSSGRELAVLDSYPSKLMSSRATVLGTWERKKASKGVEADGNMHGEGVILGL